MGMAALLGVLSRNQTQVTANGVGGKDAGADPKPLASTNLFPDASLLAPGERLKLSGSETPDFVGHAQSSWRQRIAMRARNAAEIIQPATALPSRFIGDGWS
jgi:hypothetical protein